MAQQSNIEWTEATWNPWHGCHKVSAGCKNCYMFRDKAKYGQDPNVVVRSKTRFYDPLKWKEPRRIFTCSWSDFFIEEADPWRDEAFAIMALTPHHTYQVLTKRPDRMIEYMNGGHVQARLRYQIRHNFKLPAEQIEIAMQRLTTGKALPNVHLGVSVEDQATADERIPLLLETPAAVRWISAEPLLGPVDLTHIQFPNDLDKIEDWNVLDRLVMENGVDDPTLVGVDDPIINWVVVGGESGSDARPMHPDWARSLRDQCTAAGVPFFFKQWGEFSYHDDAVNPTWPDGTPVPENAQPVRVERVGKKAAGRTLDGRTWDETPEVATAE